MVSLKPKPKPVILKSVKRHKKGVVLRYAVKAVIPGRAWLLASNGSTLTVRRGTPIQGYGVVTGIDAVRGYVFTSYRKLIRFSQEDS